MAQITYTDPGQFVHRIDILDPGGAPRNADGSDPDPVPFATYVPAALEHLSYTSGRENKLPQQVLPEVAHRVIMWFLPGVLSRMQLIFYPMGDTTAGRSFTIMRVVDPDEHRVQLHLICSERDDGR